MPLFTTLPPHCWVVSMACLVGPRSNLLIGVVFSTPSSILLVCKLYRVHLITIYTVTPPLMDVNCGSLHSFIRLRWSTPFSYMYQNVWFLALLGVLCGKLPHVLFIIALFWITIVWWKRTLNCHIIAMHSSGVKQYAFQREVLCTAISSVGVEFYHAADFEDQKL